MFSIATPGCATLTCLFLSVFRSADGDNNAWAGIAMLVSVRRLTEFARFLTEPSLSQGRKFPLFRQLVGEGGITKLLTTQFVSGMFIPRILRVILWALRELRWPPLPQSGVGK